MSLMKSMTETLLSGDGLLLAGALLALIGAERFLGERAKAPAAAPLLALGAAVVGAAVYFSAQA